MPVEDQPVVSGAGNQTVAVGGVASLQCRVKSKVPLHIKWLKKMSWDAPQDQSTINVGQDRYTVIHTGEDIPISSDGYLNKLTIYNVQECDSGLYICFVTNNVGSFTYKPSYLTVYKGNSFERDDTFPSDNESTSILVLVISLGIVVVLILILLIVSVVRKSSKAAALPDSRDVVKTLMSDSQSSSTIPNCDQQAV